MIERESYEHLQEEKTGFISTVELVPCGFSGLWKAV